MRRILADIILSIGLLAGSIAFSGWWFKTTMLQPERTTRIAAEVVQTPEVRAELARVITDAVINSTGQDRKVVEPFIDNAIKSATNVSFLADLVGAAHAAAIGQGSGRVPLTRENLTPLVGAAVADQVVKAAGGIDVPQVKFLTTSRKRVTGWITGLGTFALLCLGAAMFLHPKRPNVLRRIGGFLIGLSIWQLIITWLIPDVLVAKFTKNPWALLAGRVASVSAADLRPAFIGLAVAGAACFVAAWAWGAASAANAQNNASAPRPGAASGPAWSAWAAQNAAGTQRRKDARQVAEADKTVTFGASHKRSDRSGKGWDA